MQAIDRYLGLLGVTRTDDLRQIVRRHLVRVPFENVSKLLRRPIALDDFLDGIEHYDLGGTCYSVNSHLANLLSACGHRAELLGADMTNPDVHICIRVLYGGDSSPQPPFQGGLPVPVVEPSTSGHYLIDCGFAAPFRDPIPLDALPYTVTEGTHRYRFDHHERGIALYFGDSLSYVAHEPPRTIEDFASVIRASFAPDAHFLNHLRIARFFDDYSVELLDRKMSVHRDAHTTERELTSLDELEHAVHTDFAMPRCPVREAVAALERHTGKPLFTASTPSLRAAHPES
jgi:arylamine N-acetyltransferase